MQLYLAKAILTALLTGAVVLMVSIAVGKPAWGGVFAGACTVLVVFSPYVSLALCVAGIVLVMALGREPGGMQVIPEKTAQSGGGKEPRYLVSFLSGPLSGSSYILSKQIPRLDFGRDVGICNVVFPSDTKGVGRHHCSIHLDGNDAIFTDVSTFGCFWVDSGQRIPKDTPFKLISGTRIYLASNEIAMQIITY